MIWFLFHHNELVYINKPIIIWFMEAPDYSGGRVNGTVWYLSDKSCQWIVREVSYVPFHLHMCENIKTKKQDVVKVWADGFLLILFCMFWKPIWNTWGRPDRRRRNCFPTVMQTRREMSCSLHRVFGDEHVWSVIDQRFRRQQIVGMWYLYFSHNIRTVWRDWLVSSEARCVFCAPFLNQSWSNDSESRESSLPAGGRLSCCLWNIMCAVNEKVAVLDWVCGFLDTRRHRLMFSLLMWLCRVAVSGTGPDGPDGPELLSAACCFSPVCSRGEDPPDIQPAASAPRFPVCSLLLRIY